MSYILDALKKSEQQRDLVSILRPGGGREVLFIYMQRYAGPLVIGLVLTATLVALGLWWYANRPDAGAVPPPAKDGAATIAIEPEPAPPPQAEKTEVPKAGTEAVRVEKAPLPAKSRIAKPPVGDLAEQTRIRSIKTRSKKVAKSSKRLRNTESRKAQSTKKVARASKRLATAPASASRSRAVTSGDTRSQQLEWGAVPFLRQMPDDFRNDVPEMILNVHLYSADESENLVYINNRQYRRGERIEGRIRLEQIVPEGVVFNYNGVFFKLPRPN